MQGDQPNEAKQPIPRAVLALVVTSLVCLVAGVALAAYGVMTMQEPATPSAPAVPTPAVAPSAPATPPPAAARLTGQQLIRRFHEYLYENQTWQQMDWLGVRTLQYPPDMWMLQEMVFELEPDFIIEAGTFHGGSSLYLAMILETMGGDGKVLTIDIEPRVREASRYAVFGKRVEVIVGGSTDPELVARLRERTAGKRVLVLLDSDHRRDHVLAELRAYGPMVSEGSYVIVQDTNLNGHPVVDGYGPGPWEAVDAFLKENDEFEPDRSREKWFVSFFPRGYLKRTKPRAAGEEG